MAFKSALQAADHRIRFIAQHRQGRDDGGVGADKGARRLRHPAAAARSPDQQIDVAAIARIVLRIHQVEVRPGSYSQAVAFQPRLDHVWPADQNRFVKSFFDDDQGGAQNPFVLAIGVDHPLAGGGCRRGETPVS